MLSLQNQQLKNSKKQVSVEKIKSPPSYPCQYNKGYLIMKRVIDIIGSFAGLIVLSPILLFLSILIKIESPGPVFFRQERVGKDGRLFTFLKFRTMKTATDKEEDDYIKKIISMKSELDHKSIVFKMKIDPRLTRVGRFLRKTSLDELPQFINVLKGDMSLVGPRPPIPYELEIYDEWHKERLKCKPGVTGMWQVEGTTKSTLNDMVRLDIKYMKECSLWLDLKILLKTPFVVLTGQGE